MPNFDELINTDNEVEVPQHNGMLSRVIAFVIVGALALVALFFIGWVLMGIWAFYQVVVTLLYFLAGGVA
jgi:Flp pilus assembly protein TadB